MRRLTLGVLLLALTGSASAQSAAMRERLSGTVRAINGTADEFEAYAKGAFAKSLLDKETAEQRRKWFETVRAEYGTLQPGRAAREDPLRVRLFVTGAKKNGALILDHEADPPHKVTALAIEAAPAGTADARPTLRTGMTAEDVARATDAYVAALTQSGTFSGAVLVAKAGRPVFQRGYGLANREEQIANTADTRFNVGSINKQFTRAALALLATAGKLTLDDPVEKYLRDYPNPEGRKTTIRQLVTHQGGIPDWFRNPEFVRGPKSAFRANHDFYRLVAPMPLRFPPGSRTEYCNACFVVLGEIIERVSGTPYERLVQQQVLAPAGMNDSGFFHLDRPQPRMAVGYTRMGEGLAPNFSVRGAGGNAAGGAFVTPADLLAFEQAMRAGRLLNPQWTAWFLDNKSRISFGGGGAGVSAALMGDGTWTVVAMANLDTPAGSSVAQALFSALTAGGA